MLVARVVWNNVDHHLDPDGMQSADELIEFGQSANPRVDIAVVGHVV